MKTRTKVFLGGLVLALLVGAGAIAAHFRNQALVAQQRANEADNQVVALQLENQGFEEAIRKKGDLNELLNRKLSRSDGLRQRALQDLADTEAILRETQSELGVVKGENLSLSETIENMAQGGGTSEGTGTVLNPCGEGTSVDVRIKAGCEFSLVETNQGRVFGKLFQEVTLFDKETDEVLMGPIQLEPTDLTINLFENENVEKPEAPRRFWTLYSSLFIDADKDGVAPGLNLGVERTLIKPKFLFKERLAIKAFGQVDVTNDSFTDAILNFDPQTDTPFLQQIDQQQTNVGVRAGFKFTFDF